MAKKLREKNNRVLLLKEEEEIRRNEIVQKDEFEQKLAVALKVLKRQIAVLKKDVENKDFHLKKANKLVETKCIEVENLKEMLESMKKEVACPILNSQE